MQLTIVTTQTVRYFVASWAFGDCPEARTHSTEFNNMAPSLTDALEHDPMNAEQTTIELTPRQQELLLKGLKFIRSNVALEMAIPTDEKDQNRLDQYAELDSLESILDPGHTPRRPR